CLCFVYSKRPSPVPASLPYPTLFRSPHRRCGTQARQAAPPTSREPRFQFPAGHHRKTSNERRVAMNEEVAEWERWRRQPVQVFGKPRKDRRRITVKAFGFTWTWNLRPATQYVVIMKNYEGLLWVGESSSERAAEKMAAEKTRTGYAVETHIRPVAEEIEV